MTMENVLDLRMRENEGKRDYSVAIAVLILAAVMFGYFYALNAGCEVDGVMTWAGKVCIQ